MPRPARFRRLSCAWSTPERAMAGARAKGLADRAAGKAKRVVGELTARPDIVLEGEVQETKGLREIAEARRRAERP